MDDNPYKSPDAVDNPPSLTPRRKFPTLVQWLVVAGIWAVLIGLLLPATQTAKEAGTWRAKQAPSQNDSGSPVDDASRPR
jgi:hypothetical protein